MTASNAMDDLNGLSRIVKPLEWEPWDFGRNMAWSIFGWYSTWDGHWRLDGEGSKGTRADDPEAAAQADYTRRILSALNLDAIEALRSAPDVGEARMVEAVGSTRAEMVSNLTTDDADFWRLGDAKLMWVNEGDIANGIVRRALADQTKEAGDGHR